MTYALINFGDCAIGQGQRYVVVTPGRKWVHLYYAPTCTGFSVGLDQYKALRPRELVAGVDYRPKRLAKMIRAKCALYEGLGVWSGGDPAKRALATLKATV